MQEALGQLVGAAREGLLALSVEVGELTLGGRRVQVRRPRARTADGESEVPLVTYEHFADRDQLADVVLERILAGV